MPAPQLALPAPGTSSAVPDSIQAPTIILPLPGQSVDQLCVDIEHSQGPMNLLSDPDQGETLTSHPPRETQTYRPAPTHHPGDNTGTPAHAGAHTPRGPVPGHIMVTPLSTNTFAHPSSPRTLHWVPHVRGWVAWHSGVTSYGLAPKHGHTLGVERWAWVKTSTVACGQSQERCRDKPRGGDKSCLRVRAGYTGSHRSAWALADKWVFARKRKRLAEAQSPKRSWGWGVESAEEASGRGKGLC